MTSLPLGAMLFHADGQTDMTKLTVTSHSFANTALHKKNTSFPGRSRNLPSCHEGNTNKYYNTSIFLQWLFTWVSWSVLSVGL